MALIQKISDYLKFSKQKNFSEQANFGREWHSPGAGSSESKKPEAPKAPAPAKAPELTPPPKAKPSEEPRVSTKEAVNQMHISDATEKRDKLSEAMEILDKNNKTPGISKEQVTHNKGLISKYGERAAELDQKVNELKGKESGLKLQAKLEEDTKPGSSIKPMPGPTPEEAKREAAKNKFLREHGTKAKPSWDPKRFKESGTTRFGKDGTGKSFKAYSDAEGNIWIRGRNGMEMIKSKSGVVNRRFDAIARNYVANSPTNDIRSKDSNGVTIAAAESAAHGGNVPINNRVANVDLKTPKVRR